MGKRVTLVGIYDTNTLTLAPEVLRSLAKTQPIAAAYALQTVLETATAPYLVPSVAPDFVARNRAIGRVIEPYPSRGLRSAAASGRQRSATFRPPA